MASLAPAAVREFVGQPLKELGELYENSLKAMLVCGLEFYLSASLMASFFQCPDETVQAEQELRTLYTLAWVPMFLAAVLVYGPKLSASIFPLPEHFERNMLRCKILTWLYAFVFLIWDPDMVVKTGPSLGVSILFSVADLGRFVMDMKLLTDIEYDENGNSFILHDKTSRQDDEQQPEGGEEACQRLEQHEGFTVHVIAAASKVLPRRAGLSRQQGAARLEATLHERQLESEQSACLQEGPSSSLVGSSQKPDRRRQPGQSRSGKCVQESGLDQSPCTTSSEYVAVTDRNVDEHTAEVIAKKSITYEL
uniref:Uncharacterized protein n=1 Tax=Peronospora matthiolae TaxID=2874970 RepID=A0AAV1UDH5_9STRA